MNKVGPRHREKLCAVRWRSKHVNAEKNTPTLTGSIVPAERSNQEDTRFRYTSDSYQKILDYHVGEILLTTIIFGIILLLRLSR
jgi:hypothetical protein